MREKILYQENYKKGAARIRKELLPDRLPHMQPGWTVEAIELKAAGQLEIEGRKVEFHDMRVYMREPAKEAPDAP